jgi:hypothetical protein
MDDDDDLKFLNESLDDELAKLLADDARDDEEFARLMDSFELGSDLDEEEGAARLMYEDTKEEDHKDSHALIHLPKKVSLKTLFIALGTLACTSAIMVLVIIISLNEVSDNVDRSRAVLTIPTLAFNNGISMYPDMTRVLNGMPITLSRVTLDAFATVIYFDTLLFIENYEIILECDGKREYSMDAGFHPTADALNPNRTVLRFEPFDKDVGGFILTVKDKETESVARFSFYVNGRIISRSKQMAEPVSFRSNYPGVFITVDSASFSATGSIINFTLRADREMGRIVFGTGRNCPPHVTLRDTSLIAPLKEYPLIEYDAQTNSTEGRAYFAPLRSLDRVMTVSFNDLALRYDVNQRVPMTALWNVRGGLNTYKIATGLYDVYLEAAARQGQYLVVVAHAENPNILAPGGEDPLTDDFKRIEVHLDIQIEVDLPNGEKLLLDGFVRTRQAGTDIRFNLTDYQEELQNLEIERYTILVHSASYRIGNVSAEIDMSLLPYNE